MEKNTLLLTCLLLCGCCSTEIEPPISAGSIDKYADQTDKIESRAAAAVAMAKEANKNGESEVVANELNVASAFLPAPAKVDLDFALNRVKNYSVADYDNAIRDAAIAQAETEFLWTSVEEEKLKAKEEIRKRDAKIEELNTKLKQAEEDSMNKLYTLGAVAMIAAGGLVIAFMHKGTGFGLIAAGMLCGALPKIFGSAYFSWIAGVSLSLVAAYGIYSLWAKRACAVQVVEQPNDNK